MIINVFGNYFEPTGCSLSYVSEDLGTKIRKELMVQIKAASGENCYIKRKTIEEVSKEINDQIEMTKSNSSYDDCPF